MTNEIKGYAWLDYIFRVTRGGDRGNKDVYLEYLRALSDDDFLLAYNLVREAYLTLD